MRYHRRMRRFLTALLSMSATVVALAFVSPVRGAEPASCDGACPALLNYTFNRLQTGKPESLCQFRGKVLLIVNTASYCGYTHQYEGLEALYRRYKSRGLVVVGFPSNDFGGQEPGSHKANPLYATLLGRTGKAPQWNFHKYLVDRSGDRVESFDTKIEPDDRALVTALEKLLAEKSALPEG